MAAAAGSAHHAAVRALMLLLLLLRVAAAAAHAALPQVEVVEVPAELGRGAAAVGAVHGEGPRGRRGGGLVGRDALAANVGGPAVALLLLLLFWLLLLIVRLQHQ